MVLLKQAKSMVNTVVLSSINWPIANAKVAFNREIDGFSRQFHGGVLPFFPHGHFCFRMYLEHGNVVCVEFLYQFFCELYVCLCSYL